MTESRANRLVVVFLVLMCGTLAYVLPRLRQERREANERRCLANLKQIGLAAVLYADDKRSFPFDRTDAGGQKALLALVAGGYLEQSALTCPEDAPGEVSYEVVFKGTDGEGPPLIWDRRPHPDGTRNSAILEAHTAAVSTSAK